MTGQEAVNVAEAFDESGRAHGVILTKLDGDARGGAALSVKEVIGQPDPVRRYGREARGLRGVPPRPHGEPHPRHGRRAHAHREGRGRVRRRGDGEGRARSCCKGQFTLEDFLEQMQPGQEDGPARRTWSACCPGMPKEMQQRRDRRARARPGRGDHLLDDARGAARPDRHQRVAPASASPRGAAPPPPTSTPLLKQFKQVQQMMKQMLGKAARRASEARAAARRAMRPAPGSRAGCREAASWAGCRARLGPAGEP